MEVVLNACWVLIALASLCLWLRGSWRGASDGPLVSRLLRSLLYLACALALIFPAVSISDDLQSEEALIHDADSFRPALRSSTNHLSRSISDQRATPAGIVPVRMCALASAVVAWLVSVPLQARTDVYRDPAHARAPPAS